ncbi:MAG TPA: DUF4142 domain-containing protein, partial [Stellaceae bacterium]|nr:DUF4142 domain-containing protein [Stellaceae bacterium]
MREILVAASLAALAVSFPALAADTKNTMNDRFVDKLARDGQSEVEVGQLAQQKASSPAVKSFAQRLVSDHEKANQQLMSIAGKEGIAVPSTDKPENDPMRTKLEGLQGAEFDRAFVEAQIADHKKDIQYLEREEKEVKDPALASFIRQTLPVMESHLKMAEELQGQL